MKKIIITLFMSMFMMLTFSSAATISYIEKIDVATKDNVTSIDIKLTDKAEFTEGKLTANKKIYLDFKNTIVKNKLNINVNANKIQTVRAAQNMTKPTYVSRVVFDMDELIDYTVLVSKDGKNVVITFETEKKVNNVETVTNKVENTVQTDIKTEDATSRGNIDRQEAVKLQDKKVIVIDAGHGGKDPGAVFSSVYEKKLNLDIAKRLRKLLQAKGYEVIMTRTTDTFVELEQRANIANTNDVDLFISIHNNSMPTGYSGVMTLYSARDSEEEFSSKDLAEVIQKNMLKTLGTKDIGARERDNLVVLNKTTMPAVIVEVGCMSDANELKQLKKATFRQKAAQAIFNAIESL